MKGRGLLLILSFLLLQLCFTGVSQAEIINVNYCDVSVGRYQVDVAAGNIYTSVREVNKTFQNPVPVEIIVSNCGRDTLDGYHMWLCLSSSADRCEQVLIEERVNESVRSGYSSRIQREFTLPLNYPPGEYWLVLRVNTVAPQRDSNQTNQIIASRDKIRVLARGVDLVIDDDDTTVNYRDGEYFINVRTRVCNRGDQPSAQEWILSYYFDRVPNGMGTLLHSQEFRRTLQPSWMSGTCSDFISSRILLPTISVGDYWITLRVYQNEDIDLNNNVVTKRLSVRTALLGYPDLLISSHQFVYQPKLIEGKYYLRPGDKFPEMRVKFENRGTAPSLPFKYRVYLNSVSTGTDYLIFQHSYSNYLDAQSNITIPIPPHYVDLPIPPTSVLPPGEYRIVVEVDSENEITEVNETNNRYTVTDFIAVVGTPDIEIDSTSLTFSPSTIKTGEDLNVSCRIINKGSVPLDGYELALKIYLVRRTMSEPRIHESGRIVGVGTRETEYELDGTLLSPIPASEQLMLNSSVTVSGKLKIRDNIPGGEYYVRAKAVDIFGEIEKSNNIATSAQKLTLIGKVPEGYKAVLDSKDTKISGDIPQKIAKTTLPDFTISRIDEKKDCNFEITIKNTGANLTDDVYQRNPIMLRIQDTSTAVSGARGSILFEFPLNSVDPQRALKNTNGESKFLWTVPKNLLPLDRNLRFTVNPLKAIKESDEGNNMIERRIKCEVDSSKEQKKLLIPKTK